MDVALLVVAAAAAGWVDAVVGGGGLVLIPAMLIAQPGLPIATALGTNKLAAVFGTASAAWRYVRHVRIDLRRLIPVFVAALVFSALGATVAEGAYRRLQVISRCATVPVMPTAASSRISV